MSDDVKYMDRALELAARGRGRTSPNPMVGCVVVRQDQVVAEGFHEYAGGPHAEVNALRDQADLHDATLYVSLEPCCHNGRTPACTKLLIEKRPQRVVVAMEDPNPLVSGKGIAALRDRGVPVDVGLLEDRAHRLNEAFAKYITTGTPFVTAKCGMSLDGKIATRTGHSKWITGATAREDVHRLRNEVDAILVGAETVRQDDPSLTTRLGDRPGRDPIRIVLAGAGGLSTDARVFSIESAAPAWVVSTRPIDGIGPDRMIVLPGRDGRVEFSAMLRELGRREVTSLLIEGGGETLGSAFDAGIVDKVVFYMAPSIIGGREAVPAVGGVGVETVDAPVRLREMTATAVGEDLRIDAYVDR